MAETAKKDVSAFDPAPVEEEKVEETVEAPVEETAEVAVATVEVKIADDYEGELPLFVSVVDENGVVFKTEIKDGVEVPEDLAQSILTQPAIAEASE